MTLMALNRKHAVILTSVAVAVAIGSIVWIYPSHRLGTEHPLPQPKNMPAIAQQVLHQRMLRHSDDMKGLVEAVVLLDFDRARSLGQAIGADANLARPISGDATELNTLLPAGFFTLQDELRSRATQLARAAEQGDHAALADSFGRLTQTCLACHMLYAFDPATGQRPAR